MAKRQTGRAKGKGKSRERPQVKKAPAYLSKDPYVFEPFEKWVWREYECEKVVDLDQYIADHKDYIWYVGTDSQQYPKYKKCVFTSVLIAHNYNKEHGTGHGASAIRHVDKRRMIPKEALSSRLTVEAQRSIEICRYLEQRLLDLSDEEHDYTENIGAVTIDVNSNNLHKSNRYKDALVGMVMAYGWNVHVKPEMWSAASAKTADRKC